MVLGTGPRGPISADEARANTQAPSKQVEEELENIFARIRHSSSRGYTSLNLPPFKGEMPQKQRVRKRLEELGYTVKEEYDQREGKSWVTISWAE